MPKKLLMTCGQVLLVATEFDKTEAFAGATTDYDHFCHDKS